MRRNAELPSSHPFEQKFGVPPTERNKHLALRGLGLAITHIALAHTAQRMMNPLHQEETHQQPGEGMLTQEQLDTSLMTAIGYLYPEGALGGFSTTSSQAQTPLGNRASFIEKEFLLGNPDPFRQSFRESTEAIESATGLQLKWLEHHVTRDTLRDLFEQYEDGDLRLNLPQTEALFTILAAVNTPVAPYILTPKRKQITTKKVS